MQNKLLTFEVIKTPIGPMKAVASPEGLCALEHLNTEREQMLNKRLTRHFHHQEGSQVTSEKTHGKKSIHIERARAWLGQYFSGKKMSLRGLKLDLRGTDFERAVWDELTQLPYGRTVSYSELAVRLGKPKASRAVGYATRRNPISIIVPCHRVIGASGDLVGYAGGVAAKSFLLALESTRRSSQSPVQNRALSSSDCELIFFRDQ
jgi:methylated-DNA-[protein]-cysteine S-methyltransferase